MNTPDVSWQPSLDDDWTLAMYPNWPQPKLGKKARKKAKKLARRLARQQTYLPAPAKPRPLRERQVRLEDADGHGLRLIFCDFDGVLNQHSSGHYQLLPELVERLDRLARETGAVVVVSSWWRWIGVEALRRDLASAGYHGRVIGRTPWLGEDDYWDARERGTEVQAVLTYLGDRVQSFVILDDHDRMGDLLPYLVQTEATEGLTEADIERAAAILSPRPVSLLRPVYPDSLTRTSAPTYTYRDAQDGA
jgi:SAM-dependent methyltransferase